MIQLQERDRKLLRLCYEQQFITFEHAEFEFHTGERVVQRRVGELEDAGYLVRKDAKSDDRRFYFRLTPSGQKIAREESPFDLQVLSQINLNQFDHDSIVTSVRQRIAPRWDAVFHPERALKEADYDLVPDGSFVFADGAQVPIEIENSDKGKTRMIDLLDRWVDVDNVSIVLYVTTKTPVERLLKKCLEEVDPEIPVGLIAWDDLKSGYPKVWTQDGYTNIFNSRTL